MKNSTLLLSISTLLYITGCASTCMEYRSAITAARSENDLKRAEKFGLEALESAECNPDTNAWIPYFLAKEVYLVRKDYIQMAEMLTIAEQRNPDQLLENPFKLDDTPIETIGEGVEATRDEEWGKLFNKAVILFNKKKYNKAEKQLKLCIVVHPNRIENYSALVDVYIQNENNDLALETIEVGLNIDPKHSYLNQIKANFLFQNKDFETARELYLTAIEYSDDPGPIKIKLLNVYIELGENKKAIDFANKLLNKYPNDPNIYYNIGVIYQRMAKDIQDPLTPKFNELNQMDKPSEILVHKLYEDFRQLRKYATNAKDYYYEANDLEQNESFDTKDAIYKMKLVIKQMDEIYIPSIRETARSAGIKLE